MKFIVRLVKAAIMLCGVAGLVGLCLAADWVGYYGPMWMRSPNGYYLNVGACVATVVLFLTMVAWCICAIDWVSALHRAWTLQRIKDRKYKEHMDQ